MTPDLPVISLFSGALGLDLGLEAAGFRTRVAVECDPRAAATIRANRPDIVVIEERIERVPTERLLWEAGLRVGDPVIVSGGPACQAFSTAGQRGSVSEPRGQLFHQFLRVVREADPRFFVMENVKGILSAAIRHRPLKYRGPGYPPLDAEEQLGSAFIMITDEVARSGYRTVFDLLNAADFGVPQARERVVFVGSRDGEPVSLPSPTHAKLGGIGRAPWVPIRDGLRGLADPDPQFRALSEVRRRFLSMIPAGGNWRDLPEDLQEEALGGAFRSWGGRGGFYRRLSWDRPAPALTTSPDNKATMLCHPEELRPLSIREYARLQQFPDGWSFAGSLAQQYMQVGNAVPVGLASAVGRAIRETMDAAQPGTRDPGVFCADPELMKRLARRPTTMLNPPRMWDAAGRASDWFSSGRAGFLALAEAPEERQMELASV